MYMRVQTIMRGLLPPDKQHQAEDRALQDAEEEAEIFETEVIVNDDDYHNYCGPHPDNDAEEEAKIFETEVNSFQYKLLSIRMIIAFIVAPMMMMMLRRRQKYLRPRSVLFLSIRMIITIILAPMMIMMLRRRLFLFFLLKCLYFDDEIPDTGYRCYGEISLDMSAPRIALMIDTVVVKLFFWAE